MDTAIKYYFVILFMLTTSLAYGAQNEELDNSYANTAEQLACPPDSPPADLEHETIDAFFSLYQPYLTNISAYQPIYFLVGTDPEKSKYQVSFKYRFLKIDCELARKQPWLTGFHFGYTQTSFWDLKSDSMPFEDNSYKPEFFHVTRNIKSRASWLQGLFLKSGFEHESNGKSDVDSRNINIVYVQPISIFYSSKTKYGLSFSPRVWTYFSTGDHNPDIEDYRGYFDVDLKIGKADGFVFSSLFGWARKGGSVQLDLTLPVSRTWFENVNMYFHVQYVSALAESLIQYQERTEAVRIGFSFVR